MPKHGNGLPSEYPCKPSSLTELIRRLRAAWQESVSSSIVPGPQNRALITGWDPSLATPRDLTMSIHSSYTGGMSITSEPAPDIPSILASHSVTPPDSVFDASDIRRYGPSVAPASSTAQLYPGPLPGLREWPVERDHVNGVNAYGLHVPDHNQWSGQSHSPSVEHSVLGNSARQTPMGQYVLQPDGSQIFMSYAVFPDRP